jgi:MoaA/NifB/PqqE/SkfB family radical SAM enzyme
MNEKPLKEKVVDAKLYKKNKKLARDLVINDIVGRIVTLHKETDDKLKELEDLCEESDCGR